MEAANHSLQARQKYEKHFPKAHSFVTALHSMNLQHALEGAKISFENGADGVALVTHTVSPDYGIHIINEIKQKYPHNKAILNVLQWDPHRVFEGLAKINAQIDGVRTDNARIPGVDYNAKDPDYAKRILEQQNNMNWDGVYFGPVNFKHQAQHAPEELGMIINKVRPYLDVITTSGPSTGFEADARNVEFIKTIAGDHPVGLASGISSKNINSFINHHDISIVASGISNDYENLNPRKVLELAEIITKYNKLKQKK